MYIKRNIYILILLLLANCLLTGFAQASVSDLELRGTVFTKTLKPLAIIKDKKTNSINMYEAGESVAGIDIIEIRRGEVFLKDGLNNYTLVLPGGSVQQPVAFDFNIIKEAGVFYIDKTDVNKTMLKIPQIMRDIKIMPFFMDGKPQGIRLNALKEVDILKKAGVNPGDVIKSVNGMPLNTPYQIFQAYKKMKDKSEFKVEVVRNNEQIVLNYVVKQ